MSFKKAESLSELNEDKVNSIKKFWDEIHLFCLNS